MAAFSSGYPPAVAKTDNAKGGYVMAVNTLRMNGQCPCCGVDAKVTEVGTYKVVTVSENGLRTTTVFDMVGDQASKNIATHPSEEDAVYAHDRIVATIEFVTGLDS